MFAVVPAQPLRLDNVVQRYDWGSPEAIPGLLGVKPDGDPWAELWLGGHESAPSRVIDPATGTSGASLDLPTLIRREPTAMLGQRVTDEFGPRLPYLLKVLAAGRALSLQVHPLPHQAREGFNRENAAGIPLDSPLRSFHDEQHKPEMVIALSQFEALAGFRTPRAILSVLTGLDGDLVSAVIAQLRLARSDASLRSAFRLLLDARGKAATSGDIERTVASAERLVAADAEHANAYQTVIDLSQQHPGDPGAIASLLLNRVSLAPGESIFIPAGEVHAYLDGLGIEVMASSDNVLRAGLTHKHVDEAALVRCTSFTPKLPVIPRIYRVGSRWRATIYRAPTAEFAITLADVDATESAPLPPQGPRIVMCLDGMVTLRAAAEAWRPMGLAQGESAFLPHEAGSVIAAGDGRLVCAWVP
ncbi:MAG: mannose-6-phosphate isomerase, class I [Promicromonosporaceae bacterium]|nr:mannose-6-phosphate isomerase, class I [Promicromonosporaceae bacterium]